ncbi:energy transducer TonB family protein [Brevundimonas sp.]
MRVLALFLATCVATSAVAQDAEDLWELDAAPDTLAASVSYDNGLAVIVRCQDESLETYVRGLGLPEPRRGEDPARRIDYAFGDRPLRESSWQISENGQALFADLPAPMARRFREGGPLQMRLAAQGDNPARRYVVTLPPSPTAINRVLEACDRPATDPRDVLRASEASIEPPTEPVVDTPPRSVWDRPPRPPYPERALMVRVSGMAVVSCRVAGEGQLEECQVEVERPANAGFGEAALRGARTARLSPNPNWPASQRGGVVSYTSRFRAP